MLQTQQKDNGVCKGDPEASNSELCRGLTWVCSEQNEADVSREEKGLTKFFMASTLLMLTLRKCNQRLTWGCCLDGGAQVRFQLSNQPDGNFFIALSSRTLKSATKMTFLPTPMMSTTPIINKFHLKSRVRIFVTLVGLEN